MAPPGSYLLPDGTSIGAQYSAMNWSVRNNVSNNNFTTGYLVIDGSNNNFLTNNDAANNGTYNYEIVGDSYRFGFLVPSTFDSHLTSFSYNSKSPRYSAQRQNRR